MHFYHFELSVVVVVDGLGQQYFATVSSKTSKAKTVEQANIERYVEIASSPEQSSEIEFVTLF